MCAIIFVEGLCQMATPSTFICCHCFLFVSSWDHKGFMSVEQSVGFSVLLDRIRSAQLVGDACYGASETRNVTWIFCLRGLCCEKCAWRCTFRASFDPSTTPRHDGCCYLFSSGKLKNDKHNHFLGLGLGPKLLFCLTNEILRKLVHIAHIMLCQIIVPIAHAILSVVSRKNSIIVLPW